MLSRPPFRGAGEDGAAAAGADVAAHRISARVSGLPDGMLFTFSFDFNPFRAEESAGDHRRVHGGLRARLTVPRLP